MAIAFPPKLLAIWCGFTTDSSYVFVPSKTCWLSTALFFRMRRSDSVASTYAAKLDLQVFYSVLSLVYMNDLSNAEMSNSATIRNCHGIDLIDNFRFRMVETTISVIRAPGDTCLNYNLIFGYWRTNNLAKRGKPLELIESSDWRGVKKKW